VAYFKVPLCALTVISVYSQFIEQVNSLINSKINGQESRATCGLTLSAHRYTADKKRTNDEPFPC
jgi:hypothetical protein